MITMKPALLVLFALACAPLAPAQEVPGGKSLAELVRERFEANPPGQKPAEPEKEDELPPAPPVMSISLGPTEPTKVDPPEPEPEEAPEEPAPEETPAPNSQEAAMTEEPAEESAEEPPAVMEEPTVEEPEPEPEPAPEPEPEEEVEESTPVPLPDIAPESLSYTIKSGDTLNKVARTAYNASTFAKLIEKHNDVNPRRLKIGQELATPSLSDLVRELSPKLLATFPEETSLLVQMQHDYLALENLAREGGSQEELAAAMEDLQGNATRITEGLSSEREGISRKPSKALSQLDRFQKNLGNIEAGKISLLSNTGIQNRLYLAGALMEAMEWGEKSLD